MQNWWTDEDKDKFAEKTKYYEDEYGSFKVNGKLVNGKLTLGENLADHGGIKIAYYAYAAACNPSKADIRKFFEQWGIVWRFLITDQEAERRRLTDPHSPNEWRINGTIANVPEFLAAYNVKEGGGMWRKDPVQIW